MGFLKCLLYLLLILSLLGRWLPFYTGYSKTFFDFTLLYIDDQHLFHQHHAAFFIPASDGNMNLLGHLSQMYIESHSNVNLCPVFLHDGLLMPY